ncbi:MAG: discoidin domain-containing protein [Ignavibacteriaceae bacterium]
MEYIYIDLGSIKHIGRIDLIWETAYVKQYRIDVSNDASSWITIDQINNSDGGLDRIEISSDARYVRMYGIQRATEWGYSLFEFEVYDNTSTVGINNETISLFNGYILNYNYPNPFNPSTRISWQSSAGSWQTLKVYDVLGKEVATLVDEYKPAGKYEIEFNSNVVANNYSPLPSGIYFYQLKATPDAGQAGDFVQSKKMILLK